MARLPVVGSDLNTWGAVLNEFLRVAHNDDGTLKDDSEVQVFPVGTVMIFKQAAAPTGWTRVTDAGNTDAALILRTNGEVPGTGGSWVISGLSATAPVITMDAYTPAGTVSQPTFAGNAMGTHTHTFTGVAHQHGVPSFETGGTVYSGGNPNGTIAAAWSPTYGTAVGGGGAVASQALSTATTATGSNSSVSAGTPTGTVSQPTFTGNAVAPTGSASAPVISSTGAWRPKYVEAILASKD